MNDEATAGPFKYQGPSVPKQHAKKWIAWNSTQTKIIATGHTVREANQAAKQAGEEHPVLGKMPSGLFVGAA